MRTFFILVLLSFFALGITQETGTYYYNENYKSTSKEKASYIEEIEVVKEVLGTKKKPGILIWNMILMDGKGNKIREGQFNQGYFHGFWRVYRDGNLYSKSQFVMGVKHGTQEYYHDSGSIESIREYYLGDILDTVNVFYENGALKEQTPYVDGKVSGVNFIYYEDGSTKEKQEYLDGKRIGKEYTFYNSGEQYKVEETLENDVKLVTKYYESGGIRSQKYSYKYHKDSMRIYYENGALLVNEYYDKDDNGVEETYLSTGELMKEEFWVLGKLDSTARLIDTSFIDVFYGDTVQLSTSVKESDLLFTVVEKMPRFIDKECLKNKTADPELCSRDALMGYLGGTSYPNYARENDIQGKMFLRFTIDATGKVINVSVARADNTYNILTEQALRRIESMPLWEPGTQRGKKVKVQYVVPINFRLG